LHGSDIVTCNDSLWDGVFEEAEYSQLVCCSYLGSGRDDDGVEKSLDTFALLSLHWIVFIPLIYASGFVKLRLLDFI
jgi:hypothetical protein